MKQQTNERLCSKHPGFARRYFEREPWDEDTDYGKWCGKYLHAVNKDLLELPPDFDRTKWTDEERESHEQVHSTLLRQMRREAHRGEFMSTLKLKRARHHKILHERLRDLHVDKRIDRKHRRLVRDQKRINDDDKVYEALERGRETSGQICKRTALTTKDVRRALRRLVKARRANKLSSRRYEVIKRRPRKRLSDTLDK